MTSHCDSNPAQYERNRRFGHLVHALGRAAGGAKLPSVGLCLNASKAVSSLVKGGNDISRSLGFVLSVRRDPTRALERDYASPEADRATSSVKAKSNTRLGDLATPPADSSESSRKQHEARGLCHSAGRQLRELEKATRGSGTLPLRRPTAQRAREATRGSGTLPLRRPTAQRARESNTRLGDFATPPADSSESSRKQHEARGLCHSAGRQLRSSRKLSTRLGDFATPPADSSESSRSNTRLGDFATPPADSSESSRKQHEARGLCHSAGRQLGELEKATRGSGTLPSAGRQLRELEKATRGSGTLPLRRPTAQRAPESNTRLGDFATPPADSSESSRKQHEAQGLCHSVGLQFKSRESNTRLGDFATPPADSLELKKHSTNRKLILPQYKNSDTSKNITENDKLFAKRSEAAPSSSNTRFAYFADRTARK
ncbi:hypothetical protein PUN28_017861 [Cardiocondyla obscurior]|uniref:Uncharacterized protein n=1 Tax=Cardiocondyla obscurior TaxID=286306 RepID=A0AAW2EJB9_9HYME